MTIGVRHPGRRPRRRLAHRARSPACSSTRSGSRAWPRRSTCETTCSPSSSWRRPRARRRERRRRLTFVFVGGGYAGVEAMAELEDLCRDASRYYPELRAVPRRWLLVDAADHILPELGGRPRGVRHRAARAARVRAAPGPGLRAVDGHGAELADGTVVPAATVVWTAGVRPQPLAAELGLPLDERGRVPVDECLRVPGHARRVGARRRGRGARTPPPGARPTRPPASTRCARRGGWRATCSPRPAGGRLGPTAIACAARWRRSGGTRASPSCSAGSACAASPAGGSPAPTTCTSCRSRAASCASSPTGRWACSSAETWSSWDPRAGRTLEPPPPLRLRGLLELAHSSSAASTNARAAGER